MKPYHNVMIAIPTRGTIQIALLPSLINWIQNGAAIVIETAPLVDNARNKLVRVFLDSDKEYLLFIDSDIIPDNDSLQRLIGHDKDIISGVHNVIQGYDNGVPIIIPSVSKTFKRQGQGIERTLAHHGTGLQQVEGTATSFLLIKRKVFDEWKSPWFMYEWNEGHTDFIGEDYWFCLEAQKRGFEVWADMDLLVRHVKEAIV